MRPVVSQRSLTVGLGGATADACVAIVDEGAIRGICAQERVTRVRGAAFNESGLPDEALRTLLTSVGYHESDIECFAVAEKTRRSRENLVEVEHHLAHASAAFLPSRLKSAIILVCDEAPPYVSVWKGEGSTIRRLDTAWAGIDISRVCSEAAEVFGFTGPGAEQRMEALARLTAGVRPGLAEPLFESDSDRLELRPGWRDVLDNRLRGAELLERSALAAAIQVRLCDVLVHIVRELVKTGPESNGICLGGSVFFNSYFNSRLKLEFAPRSVHIPVNPGNAGLCVGAALSVLGNRRYAAGPFLGPSFSEDAIKETLDNCKLTYEWANDGRLIDVAVDSLVKGRLVAWFDGPMEWGGRALGGRSILASPFAPFVLENLNRFLKKREPWRGYALCSTTTDSIFEGPQESPYMECDYQLKQPNRLRAVLPSPGASVRLQTVGTEGNAKFKALLEAFGERSGMPVLVNTSFNGFLEPIVFSPRDAVRVFFGTGADVLIAGPFIVKK